MQQTPIGPAIIKSIPGIAILFICTFLFCSVQVHGQFNIGFTIEGTDVITNDIHWANPINAIGVVIGYSPTKKMHLEVRASYDSPLLVYYKGANYGIYLSYDIKPIYLIAHYTLHSNDGSSDEGVVMKRINLIGAGAGLNITSNFSFELVYGKTFKTEPWIWYYDIGKQNYWSQDITGVIKGVFKFNWKLK